MSRLVCARCVRPNAYCLCSAIPSLSSRTRVVIFQHPDEAGHALNTARLAALGLQNARLLVGVRFNRDDWFLPGHVPYLAFPGPQALNAESLPPESLDRPRLLLVPDGTWRKARSLLHHNPDWVDLPRLTLAHAPDSRYRVRQAQEQGALSTIEAITYILNAIEAPASFNALLRPFDVLIEGQIAAMGEAAWARHSRSGLRVAAKTQTPQLKP